MSVRRIALTFPHGTFEYRLGNGVIDRFGQAVKEKIGGSKAVIISDISTREKMGVQVSNQLSDAGYQTSYYELSIVDSGTDTVTSTHLQGCLEALANLNLEANDLVVAVGDSSLLFLATLAADIYEADVQFVSVPINFYDMTFAAVGEAARVRISADSDKFISTDRLPNYMLAELKLLDKELQEDIIFSYLNFIKIAIADSPFQLRQINRDMEKLIELHESKMLAAFVRAAEGKARIIRAAIEKGSPHPLKSLEFGAAFAKALSRIEDLQLTASQRIAEGLRFESRLAADVQDFDIEHVKAIDSMLDQLGLTTVALPVTPDELFNALWDGGSVNSPREFMLPKEPGTIDAIMVKPETAMQHASALIRSRGV